MRMPFNVAGGRGRARFSRKRDAGPPGPPSRWNRIGHATVFTLVVGTEQTGIGGASIYTVGSAEVIHGLSVRVLTRGCILISFARKTLEQANHSARQLDILMLFALNHAPR